MIAPWQNHYQGLNSGLMLFQLSKMRESLEYKSELNATKIEELSDRFSLQRLTSNKTMYNGVNDQESNNNYLCRWKRQLWKIQIPGSCHTQTGALGTRTGSRCSPGQYLNGEKNNKKNQLKFAVLKDNINWPSTFSRWKPHLVATLPCQFNVLQCNTIDLSSSKSRFTNIPCNQETAIAHFCGSEIFKTDDQEIK